jgi:mRNA interferase MazF
MNRGDIYFAELDPSIGGETRKSRPVLIISNDVNNKYSNTIAIIPITSNISKVYVFEVLLPKEKTGLKKDSKLLCQQIRTIDKSRLAKERSGKIHPDMLNSIEYALLLHLGIKGR